MKNVHKLFLIIVLNTLCSSVIAQVDSIGSKKVVMDINGNTLKIPYYSNYHLDVLNNNITQAVIVIHGTNRDAYNYFANMTTAAALRPTETDSLLVVAPQFLTDVDIDFHNLDSEHLYWSSGGWKSGSLSKDINPPRPERVSSYTVLDTIISKLTLSFPNLKSIVFTGHSAGGQLTNRYAACSSVVDNLCNQGNTYIKFIVANSSSYLYLNNLRRISGTLDQFEVPNTSCLTYNEWKYGLDNLYSYPLSAGIDSIKNMMKRKQVIYLLGENDNDPNSPSLGTSCNSMLQGDHRLERGSIYFNHLIDFYGSSILENHSIDTVPGVGHSNLDMYTSAIGLYHLFESYPVLCQNNINPPTVIPDSLVLNGIGTDATDGSNGSVNLTVTGGTAPYTYLWSNGSITEDISGLIPNVYTVTVTDDNACTETLSITITEEIGCTFITIDSESFESGWGIWNVGGTDARRSSNDAAYANNGIYCVRLRDNTSASTITTSNMDLSAYSELMIDLSYYVVSFEGTEDFWLQISTDGGATFTTVQDWVRGTDFNNDERHNTTVTIPGPFSSTTQFRFRCDATSNADMVYIDDLNILGCPNASGYNLITAINGGGSISLSPSGGNYAAGTQVTITAVSDAGTQFNTWSGGLTGSVNPVTVTIMSNMNITANFSSLGGCSYSIVDNQGFETGWGIWNDGGNDARRSSSDVAFANNGTYCIRLRNATDFSVMTTDNMDLSTYDELTVEFSYYALTFEGAEDFWLQISTDGGATFTTKEDWVRGMDFFNEERYNTSAIISGPFSSSTQLRIRCDASGSSDEVYIDDVVIKGCTASNALIASNGNYVEEETSQKTKSVHKNSLVEVSNLETLQINLHPNPVKDELTIVFQKEQIEPIKVEIIDLTGKVIKILTSNTSNIKMRQVKIDISNLHNGAYFIRIAGKVGKFIKLN